MFRLVQRAPCPRVSVAVWINLRHEKRHITEDGVERPADLLYGLAGLSGLSPSNHRRVRGRRHQRRPHKGSAGAAWLHAIRKGARWAPVVGANPHVRVHGATGAELLGFYAYDPAFTGGVFVAGW